MGKYTDIAKTLYSYFSQFCPAYAKGNIPSNATRPYLTYTVDYVPDFEDNIIQVMVYTEGKSLSKVAEIVDKIEENLGEGITIKVSGNSFTSMYLRKGTPFAQYMNDDDTEMSAYINIINKIL